MAISYPTKTTPKTEAIELLGDKTAIVKKEYTLNAVERKVTREQLVAAVDRFNAKLAKAQADLDAYDALAPQIVEPVKLPFK